MKNYLHCHQGFGEIRRMMPVVMLSFLLARSLYAQQEISGNITSESGERLPGVTVLEQGTTNGTITDIAVSYTHLTLPTTSRV